MNGGSLCGETPCGLTPVLVTGCRRLNHAVITRMWGRLPSASKTGPVLLSRSSCMAAAIDRHATVPWQHLLPADCAGRFATGHWSGGLPPCTTWLHTGGAIGQSADQSTDSTPAVYMWQVCRALDGSCNTGPGWNGCWWAANWWCVQHTAACIPGSATLSATWDKHSLPPGTSCRGRVHALCARAWQLLLCIHWAARVPTVGW